MNIPNGFYRTSIKGLILDDKKRFLLTREENGHWDFPGGAMDFGETYRDTIKREIREEMGLEVVDIGKYPMYFITEIHHQKVWKTYIIFEVKVKNLKFIPSNECLEIRFFDTKTALKENIYPGIKEFLDMYDEKRH